jgi:hypothetical protein
MQKNENTPNSDSFLALAFFRGICLSRHQRIWNQHKILRFLIPIKIFFKINFFWGHNSTFCNCTFSNILKKVKSYFLPISIILRLIPIKLALFRPNGGGILFGCRYSIYLSKLRWPTKRHCCPVSVCLCFWLCGWPQMLRIFRSAFVKIKVMDVESGGGGGISYLQGSSLRMLYFTEDLSVNLFSHRCRL